MSEMMPDTELKGIVNDIDGNVYKTIKIGTQVWMAENLKTTRYNEGTVISEVTDFPAWQTLTTPGYCWYNNDSTSNAKLFGALYNYCPVTDTNSLNVCPIGWRVPTDAEWTKLVDFIEKNGCGGTSNNIGKSLSARFRWIGDLTARSVGNDLVSNNNSGFAGLPGGGRSFNGTFVLIGKNAFWWSSTEVMTAYAWVRKLENQLKDINRYSLYKGSGFSVRCLRN
jgi:uncharacterized protein (TIGR02145 family)